MPAFEPAIVLSERECLARIIASEAGSQSVEEQSAIAWVVRNRAKKARTSIFQLACNPPGRQGERYGPGGKRRRPFASRQAPKTSHRELAARILAAPQSGDPTNGATTAFEPALQDKLHAAGKIRRTANQVRAKWTGDYKLRRIGMIGRWELYRSDKTPRPAAAREHGDMTKLATALLAVAVLSRLR